MEKKAQRRSSLDMRGGGLLIRRRKAIAAVRLQPHLDLPARLHLDPIAPPLDGRSVIELLQFSCSDTLGLPGYPFSPIHHLGSLLAQSALSAPLP
jgi:hypothetical protein